MTKQECEQKILTNLMEIANVYMQYNPDGDYLDLAFIASSDGVSYMFNNAHKVDEDKRISFFHHVENKKD